MIELIGNKNQQYRTDLPYFDYNHQILDLELKTEHFNDIQLLRGPLPSRNDLESGNYFITVGSAHTFGRFSNKTYGQFISEQINIPCLNAGVSDASPSLFCRPEWLKYINNARFAIVQIMSGRTGNNSVFLGGGVTTRRDSGSRKRITKVLNTILEKQGNRCVRRLLKESQKDFLAQYIALKNSITVPKIHLWHSARKPEDMQDLDSVAIEDDFDIRTLVTHDYINQFPHLINKEMLDEMIAGDIYAEYVSSKGFPHYFYDENGNKITLITRSHNDDNKDQIVSKRITDCYYPTQEQHKEVAELLIPMIQRLTT